MDLAFQNILVPISGREIDTEAIKLASKLVKKPEGQVIVVHVIPVDRSLPLDAELQSEVSRAEAMLSTIEELGARMGCDMVVDLLQARDVGSAIVEETRERQADLIIIALPYKKHFGHFCLGEVVPYTLEKAPCPVIIYHEQNPGATE